MKEVEIMYWVLSWDLLHPLVYLNHETSFFVWWFEIFYWFFYCPPWPFQSFWAWFRCPRTLTSRTSAVVNSSWSRGKTQVRGSRETCSFWSWPLRRLKAHLPQRTTIFWDLDKDRTCLLFSYLQWGMVLGIGGTGIDPLWPWVGVQIFRVATTKKISTLNKRSKMYLAAGKKTSSIK